MVLICGGTQLLRSATRDKGDKAWEPPTDAAVVAEVVAAAEAVVKAAPEGTTPLSRVRKPTVVDGADRDVVVVLQREVAAVGGDASSAAFPQPTNICSIDATTCLVAALRDPSTERVVMAHFDHGGDQTREGIQAMLSLLRVKGGMTAEDAPARAPVQLYLLGATQHPEFSEATLGAFLRQVATIRSLTFELLPLASCFWSQNVTGSKNIRHRGLNVNAATGAAMPCEPHSTRAYPAGRLRALRCFADSMLLSPVTLLPEETVVLAQMTADAEDHPFMEEAAFHLVVRPFKWASFGKEIAQVPLESFAKQSTSPQWEPADFAQTLKGAMVYGALVSPIDVFKPRGNKPQPVVFRVESDGGGTVFRQISPKEASPEAPAAKATAEPVPDEATAPSAASSRYGV